MKTNQTPVYRYYCPYRPPDLGAVPRGAVNVTFYPVKSDLVALPGREAYGHADYNHPLTQKSIDDYELIPHPANPIQP